MLKTKRGSQVWLITQPAHAELSGQMAAHWGNEEFATPGHFAASADSERVRREVVLAVAEHDNGWWEWEADPPLSADDGLPKGLGEVVAHPVAGMEQLLVGRAFYPGEQKEEARGFWPTFGKCRRSSCAGLSA